METNKRNQSGPGLGATFRPNKVQCCEKSKIGIINVFFHILHGEYLLYQKVVVVQILEWKFKANIAGNATSEGCLGSNFCPIWVENGKKLIIFKIITH